jgi:hypothetical protein
LAWHPGGLTSPGRFIELRIEPVEGRNAFSEALPEVADQLKAMGFAERAGYSICGGLPAQEIPKLSSVV